MNRPRRRAEPDALPARDTNPAPDRYDYKTLLDAKDARFTEGWLSQKLGGGRLLDGGWREPDRALTRGLGGPGYGGAHPEAIYGADDRNEVINTRATPWSSICRISTTFTDSTTAAGTGFLISPNCVVTAGHVLLNIETTARPRRIVVEPGHRRGVNPFQSFVATGYDVHDRFEAAHDRGFDIAVAYLGATPGLEAGYLGFGAFPDAALGNVLVNVAGYPRDRPGQMVHAAGRISGIQPTRLAHNVDTIEGQSGAPVIFVQDDRRMIVLGVHSWGDPNYATRITGQVFDWLRQRSGLR